ncbi:hypothetical protein LTS18_000875 [Coniosporium uncinatum]|uniref:Uncharacterized protein n=1 Tax=Coniosporium uncinatum TaxID=93489 RepID=A0ACC3D862_9PEZI|nr:hypothetical protein LTS18_000875 [Coniosporium uncinatum]
MSAFRKRLGLPVTPENHAAGLQEQVEGLSVKHFERKRMLPAPDPLAEPRRFLDTEKNCYAETAHGSAKMVNEPMLSQARVETIAELEERINIQSKEVDRLLDRMMDLQPGVNIRNSTAELQRVPHDDDDLNDCNIRFLDAHRLIAWTDEDIEIRKYYTLKDCVRTLMMA